MAGPDFTYVMHHVGARGGSCGFTLPAAFHADAMNVLYEPDTDCIKQIEERTSASQLKSLILPYALGEQAGRGTFNFHLDPYANSFRRLNPRFAGYSQFAIDYDHVLGESISPVRQAEMEVRTLDGLVADRARPTPAPDFLLIDTEGTAYEVLSGARDCLRSDVLAVWVEAEFQPLWHGEQLFGEMSKLLDGLGFDLATLDIFSGISPHRAPVGLRGRGFVTGSDALFLRRTESLAEMAPDGDTRWAKACKLACTAFWLGQVEYGIKALECADAMSPSAAARAAAAGVSHMRFLARVREAIARVPAKYPPTFGARYSAGEIQSRFEPSYAITATGIKGRIKARLLAFPALLALVRALRRALTRIAALARAGVAALRRLARPRYSEFERILLEYGFADVADLVRSRRIAEEPFAK